MNIESVNFKVDRFSSSKIESFTIKSLAFLFIFFLILGPKILFVDTSILIPFCIVFLLSPNMRLFSENQIFLFFFLIFLICYQIIVQFLNAEFDAQSVARLIRASFQMFLVIAFYSVISKSNCYEKIPKIVVFVLLIHAILIIFSALFVDFNVLLSSLSGNDRAKLFRSSGLLAGFDLAGFLCICGVLIVFFITSRTSHIRFSLTAYLLFYSATFFTSRLTLAICTLLVFIFVLVAIFNSKSTTVKILSLTILIALFYYIFDYFKIVFELTFGLNFFNVDPLAIEALRALYAADTVDVLSNMYFLPNSELSILFGTGSGEVLTDVGYVRNTFRFGIVGVLASLFFYFALVYSKIVHHSKVQILFLLLLSLIVLLSFKNDYYFVRAAFPLILLLSLYNYRNYSLQG